MDKDRERIHARHPESACRDRAAEGRNPDQQEAEPEADRSEAASTAGMSDSEQAQANLERMLESGEENPIS